MFVRIKILIIIYFIAINIIYSQNKGINASHFSNVKDLSGGYIPSPVNPDFSSFPAFYKQGKTNKKALPARYDLRETGKMTPVLNQGMCSSCWAFASCASIESRMLITKNITLDLSESNINNCHGFQWKSCTGGNAAMAISYLTRMDGPVDEEADSYVPYAQQCKKGLTPILQITDARYLPKDINTIKQAIYDYGAVYTVYHNSDSYYNKYDYTYYCGNASRQANHAVTLAGWDDNKMTAGGKGAWIVKNSAGSLWGESGYFYLSYKDATALVENLYFPQISDYKPHSVLYYYDRLGWTKNWGYDSETAYGLVKFISSEYYPIRSVSTWINASNTDIDIEVYDNFDGTQLSGLLAEINNQKCMLPGYYTFEIPEPIFIEKGNDFYIKVRYYSPGSKLPLPVEAFVSAYANPSIERGRCWSSGDAVNWDMMGVGSPDNFDLCIRANAYIECTPPVAAIHPKGPLSICNGETIELSAGNQSELTYKWYKDNVAISGATKNVFSVTEPGIYSVLISNNNQCFGSSNEVKIISLNAEIYAKAQIYCQDSIKLVPQLVYTATGSFLKVYQPDTLLISQIGLCQGWGGDILTAYAGGEVKYVKDSDSSFLGCSADAYQATDELLNKIALIDRGSCSFSLKAYNAQQAGAAAVIIANDVPGNSVTSMATGEYASKIKIPVIMISYNDAIHIRNIISDSGYAKASIGYDGNKLVFEWTPKEGLDDPYIFSPLAKPLMKTSYAINVSSEVCSSTAQVLIDIIDVLNINLGSDTTIYTGSSITLNAGYELPSPNSELRYIWSNGDTSETVTLYADKLGIGVHKYSVTVTDSYICKWYDEINISVQQQPASVVEPVMSGVWLISTLYPNPADNYVSVSLQVPASGFQLSGTSLQTGIYDLTGRKLDIQPIINHNDFQQYTINFNTSSLSEGIYFIKLQHNKSLFTNKFIVIRRNK